MTKPFASPRTRLHACLALCATTVIVLPGCRVDRSEFERRVFSCDTAAPDPGCGTDPTGRLMSCFSARQIGATDFCAKTCDAASSPTSGDGAICLESGIELKSCIPTDDDDLAAHPLGACDQPGLACYRTDLLKDEGVCTTMNPCKEDRDCRDPVRSVCATTFLANIYSDAQVLKRDHMFCLQTDCEAGLTSCSPGETCLRKVIPADAHPPDICVPNCDSNLRCPPNFLCYKKVSTPLAPAVCIPGLLGFTCDSAIDCMLGDCVDTGIGYNVCTAACDTDADCSQFDGEQGKFSCIKNPGAPAAPGNCQTPDAYRGSICGTTLDCGRNKDEICNRFDPTDVTGTCLLPCTSEHKCDQRGGINHTCLPSASGDAPDGVCFPGYFSFPCAGDNNCLGDLTCRSFGPGQPDSCSLPCENDSDCAGDRWIGAQSWCGKIAGLPVCLPLLPDGAACPSDGACSSGHCNGTPGMCVPKGGTP